MRLYNVIATLADGRTLTFRATDQEDATEYLNETRGPAGWTGYLWDASEANYNAFDNAWHNARFGASLDECRANTARAIA